MGLFFFYQKRLLYASDEFRKLRERFQHLSAVQYDESPIQKPGIRRISFKRDLPHESFWIPVQKAIPDVLKRRTVELFEAMHELGIIHNVDEVLGRDILIDADARVHIVNFQGSNLRRFIGVNEFNGKAATEMRRLKFLLDFPDGTRSNEINASDRGIALSPSCQPWTKAHLSKVQRIAAIQHSRVLHPAMTSTKLKDAALHFWTIVNQAEREWYAALPPSSTDPCIHPQTKERYPANIHWRHYSPQPREPEVVLDTVPNTPRESQGLSPTPQPGPSTIVATSGPSSTPRMVPPSAPSLPASASCNDDPGPAASSSHDHSTPTTILGKGKQKAVDPAKIPQRRGKPLQREGNMAPVEAPIPSTHAPEPEAPPRRHGKPLQRERPLALTGLPSAALDAVVPKPERRSSTPAPESEAPRRPGRPLQREAPVTLVRTATPPVATRTPEATASSSRTAASISKTSLGKRKVEEIEAKDDAPPIEDTKGRRSKAKRSKGTSFSCLPVDVHVSDGPSVIPSSADLPEHEPAIAIKKTTRKTQRIKTEATVVPELRRSSRLKDLKS